jgi:hypothetical protein
MKFVSGILFTGKAGGRTIVLIAQPPEGGGVKETAVSNPTVVARTSGADPFCDEVLADPSAMHRELRGRVRFCGYRATKSSRPRPSSRSTVRCVTLRQETDAPGGYFSVGHYWRERHDRV